MNSKLLKGGILILSNYSAASFKTLSPLFMGDDNVLNINSPSNIQRWQQRSSVAEPEQTLARRGCPKCYYMLNRFSLETFYVDRCQEISGCHMMAKYIQPEQKIQFLRCFIYSMPQIQVFGNIWVIYYIFHFSSGFGSQSLSANENSQVSAVFERLTWEKPTFSSAFPR